MKKLLIILPVSLVILVGLFFAFRTQLSQLRITCTNKTYFTGKVYTVVDSTIEVKAPLLASLPLLKKMLKGPQGLSFQANKDVSIESVDPLENVTNKELKKLKNKDVVFEVSLSRDFAAGEKVSFVLMLVSYLKADEHACLLAPTQTAN